MAHTVSYIVSHHLTVTEISILSSSLFIRPAECVMALSLYIVEVKFPLVICVQT